jgi:hypothetical protein
VITSERREFIGGHVTPEVHEALRSEALKHAKGKSATIHQLLREALIARGHEIKEDEK